MTECETHIEALMAEVDDLESRCDRLEHDLCTAQHACEDLEHCIAERHDELTAANAAIDDLSVQCKFWRQAAEHAVKGWNDLEDKHEQLLATARGAESLLANTLAFLDPPCESAPAIVEEIPRIDFAAITKDPASTGFPRLHVVEEETPLKEKP